MPCTSRIGVPAASTFETSSPRCTGAGARAGRPARRARRDPPAGRSARSSRGRASHADSTALPASTAGSSRCRAARGQPAGAPEHRGLRRCRGLVGRYGRSAAGGSPWRRHCTAEGADAPRTADDRPGIGGAQRQTVRWSSGSCTSSSSSRAAVDSGSLPCGLAEVDRRPVPLDARGDPVVAGVQAGRGRRRRWRAPAPSRPARCRRPRRSSSCRSPRRPARRERVLEARHAARPGPTARRMPWGSAVARRGRAAGAAAARRRGAPRVAGLRRRPAVASRRRGPGRRGGAARGGRAASGAWSSTASAHPTTGRRAGRPLGREMRPTGRLGATRGATHPSGPVRLPNGPLSISADRQ